MIHFGKDKSETRLLVRMEKPPEGQAAAPQGSMTPQPAATP
jgi:hypothetical protein